MFQFCFFWFDDDVDYDDDNDNNEISKKDCPPSSFPRPCPKKSRNEGWNKFLLILLLISYSIYEGIRKR